MHRQPNRHSGEIREIVPAQTRVRAHAEITRTPLTCGGDECDADSLSHFIHTCSLCMYIFVLFPVCLSDYTLQLVFFLSVSPRYRMLYLNNNQFSALQTDIFAGLSSLGFVCVFVVAEY